MDDKLIAEFLFSIYDLDYDTYKSNFVRILKVANDLGYSIDNLTEYINKLEEDYECPGRYISDYWYTISAILELILSKIYNYYDKISDEDKLMITENFEFYFSDNFNKHYLYLLSTMTNEDKLEVYNDYFEDMDKELSYMRTIIKHHIEDRWIYKLDNDLNQLSYILESLNITKTNIKKLEIEDKTKEIKEKLLNGIDNLIEKTSQLQKEVNSVIVDEMENHKN